MELNITKVSLIKTSTEFTLFYKVVAFRVVGYTKCKKGVDNI